MESESAVLVDRAMPIMLVPRAPLENAAPVPLPDPPPDPPREPEPPPMLARGRLRDPSDT